MTAACAASGARPWSCPDARLVLRANAPRDMWLAKRRAGLGSSDASAVLGVNRWTSPYEVWAEKRGLIPPQPDNDAMDLGRRLEPIVVDWWAEQAGIPIRRAGLMANLERPWQLASVDRLAACGGIVEAKTLSWRVAEEWDDGQTPDHAEAQVQHQLAVTGRSHAHVVGLQDGRTWLERLVERDDQLIPDITKIEAEFWQLVLDGVEPPVDGSAATTETLNARWPGIAENRAVLGERLAELRQMKLQADHNLAAAKITLDTIKNELRALLGDATEGFVGEGDDDPAVTWRRNGVFSEKQLAERYPDLHAALLVPVQTTALDVDRLKSEHPDAYTACRARVLRVTKPKKTKETH